MPEEIRPLTARDIRPFYEENRKLFGVEGGREEAEEMCLLGSSQSTNDKRQPRQKKQSSL